jgi:hypothetical protein
MTYTHQNMWECCKNEILLIYIVHLLDKYKEKESYLFSLNIIVQNMLTGT